MSRKPLRVGEVILLCAGVVLVIVALVCGLYALAYLLGGGQ